MAELLVEPGYYADIAGRDPAWAGGPDFEDLSAHELNAKAKKVLAKGIDALSEAQELVGQRPVCTAGRVPSHGCGR